MHPLGQHAKTSHTTSIRCTAPHQKRPACHGQRIRTTLLSLMRLVTSTTALLLLPREVALAKKVSQEIRSQPTVTISLASLPQHRRWSRYRDVSEPTPALTVLPTSPSGLMATPLFIQLQSGSAAR